nr:2128_t:CDS:2 [Entrophospora candida]
MTKSNANKIKFVKFPTGIPRHSWRKARPGETPWIKSRVNQNYKSVVHRMKYELNDLIDYLSPTEVERSLRIFSIKRIENAIKEKFVGSEVFVFGSYRYGCYLPTSNIDIVVYAHVNTPEALLDLADYLETRNYSCCVPLVTIGAAKHVFKSVDNISKFLNDIPILQKMLLVLKYFMKHHNLDDPSNGGMRGYTLFYMLHPYYGTLKMDDDSNLDVLIIEFFELYGTQFNYTDLAIITANEGNEGCYCLKPDLDNVVKIQKAFKRAYLRLVNRVGLLERKLRPVGTNHVSGFQNGSILSSILFVSEDLQISRRKLAREYHDDDLKQLVQRTGNDLGTLLQLDNCCNVIKKYEKEIKYMCDQYKLTR